MWLMFDMHLDDITNLKGSSFAAVVVIPIAANIAFDSTYFRIREPGLEVSVQGSRFPT